MTAERACILGGRWYLYTPERTLEKLRTNAVLVRLLGNAYHQSFVIPQILDQKFFVD